MIFAGDFAQQPPVAGGENGSLYSRTVGRYSADAKSQKAALGKAIWHLFTVVVILRKNHRQQGLTPRDRSLQRLLHNLRMRDCDDDDISYMMSLRIDLPSNGLAITDERFRNVSVITAYNITKDAINDLGVRRFATETGQQLTDFFADDKRPGGSKDKPVLFSRIVQEMLWSQAPTFSEYVPGKLSLCHGMPVMLRHNWATELAMNKGQEGVVYDWIAGVGRHGQRTLQTLFVLLINPPRTVHFGGLPENVVPCVARTVSIQCDLPKYSGAKELSVSRTQVEVLPNFAMTDYASQGKSRDYNVVDLKDCSDHHAYYVALSRGRTSEGTVILRDFHPSRLQGGCSGALRQEFRDLEMLNDITRMRYEGTLPESVQGHRRKDLIQSFRRWKGP
ncbi:hypothetical protein EV715DRAFT_162138, partial [Schizophyllum commune]